MRVFVTGGAGFVGRRVVAGLLARSDAVVAAVRDPERATELRTAGAQLVGDDLSDTTRIADHLLGADAAIHIAGMYRVGIPASERAAMWDANVGTTTRILEAADTAHVPRIVYVSTVPYRALDDVGVGLVHVDDLADGIIAALDRGRIGESYVLSGPRTTLGEAVTLAAGLAGRRPPRLRLPMGLLRVMAPLGGLIGQPNLREVISASAGVTYWASSAKAERELAFRPRSIETGLRDTFGVP